MSINITKTHNSSYLLTTSVVLPSPQKNVFSFFSKAENLEVLTPNFLNFKIITQLPIQIKEGTIIDYKISLYGFPLRWRTLIKEWRPDEQFIDKQIMGPYLLWEHTHEFVSINQNQTLMKDQVEYRVPGGSIIHHLFVKKQLTKIFEYRNKKILSIFKGD